MTHDEFVNATGREPEQDDLDRANCAKAGKPGHFYCGVCACGQPRFTCAHLPDYLEAKIEKVLATNWNAGLRGQTLVEETAIGMGHPEWMDDKDHPIWNLAAGYPDDGEEGKTEDASCSDVCEAVTDELVSLGFRIDQDDENHADVLKALEQITMVRRDQLFPFYFSYRDDEIVFTVLARNEGDAERKLKGWLRNTGSVPNWLIISVGDLHENYLQLEAE